MKENTFIWESKVRDYELDCLGIVNNATFINYIEQARNDYARTIGIDFVEYHQQGYDFVVAGIEIQYRRPLKANNEFYVTIELTAFTDKRIHFEQQIKLKTLDKLAATALVTVACVDQKTGKACMPDFLKNKLSIEKYDPTKK